MTDFHNKDDDTIDLGKLSSGIMGLLNDLGLTESNQSTQSNPPRSSSRKGFLEDLISGVSSGGDLSDHLDKIVAARRFARDVGLADIFSKMMADRAAAKTDSSDPRNASQNAPFYQNEDASVPQPEPFVTGLSMASAQAVPKLSELQERISNLEKNQLQLQFQNERMQSQLEQMKQELAKTSPRKMEAQTADSRPVAVSTLETIMVGLIPENVTEQAWPILLHNLKVAGVPIPEVTFWIDQDTLVRLQRR